jgi:hypothetical protein
MVISVSEIYLEQQKTEKIWLDFEEGKRKGWTIFETTDNPDAGVGMIAVFRADGGMTKVSWVLPRRWRNHSARLARHEQTIHVGARPERKTVTREIA